MKKFIISSTVLTILIASTITAIFALSNNSETSEPTPTESVSSQANTITVPYDLEHKNEYITARVEKMNDYLNSNLEPTMETLMEHGIYLVDYMTEEQREELGIEVSNIDPNAELPLKSDISAQPSGFVKTYSNTLLSYASYIMQDQNPNNDNRVSVFCVESSNPVTYTLRTIESTREYMFTISEGQGQSYSIPDGHTFYLLGEVEGNSEATVTTQVTLDRVG